MPLYGLSCVGKREVCFENSQTRASYPLGIRGHAPSLLYFLVDFLTKISLNSVFLSISRSIDLQRMIQGRAYSTFYPPVGVEIRLVHVHPVPQ